MNLQVQRDKRKKTNKFKKWSEKKKKIQNPEDRKNKTTDLDKLPHYQQQVDNSNF